MSVPRRIVPGTTYLLSRRCFGRQFLLRPSTKVNQIFKFCLGFAAASTGMRLHGYCVLSNHYHLVATDVHGNLPIFMHWLNEYVAKCVNAELGRWESFWAPGSYSAVALADREAIIDRLVYVAVNPVEAGLVASQEEWPGARSLVSDIDGPPEVIPRPEGFFREDGPVPEATELRMVLPQAFEGDRTCLEAVRELVTGREGEIRDAMRQRGRRFLGVRAVLAQNPLSRPTTAEPRRGLDPRVAARDKWRRIEALQRLKTFVQAYRAALQQFMAGDWEAVFPFGTWAMQVRFGVACGGP